MIVTAHMKDGRTAFQFEEAEQLRRLLHNRPGQKPHGGTPVEAVEWRFLDGSYKLMGNISLRFIDNHTISWVEQGPPL